MGLKRKTIRNLRDTPDTREEIDNMAKVEETKPVQTSSEVTVEKVEALNVGDSPLMEPMIERKGGDDFLYKDKPQAETTQDTTAPQPEPQVNSGNGGNINVPPVPPTSTDGPKEFQFDPTPQASGPVNPGDPAAQGGSGEINPIPQEISDESSKMIAEMLLEGFGMIAPEMADRYSKINEGQIRKLEQDGKIQAGLVEIAKNANKNNKNAVRVTNEQKNLIRKPLIKVLEVQGVKASPESMLVIAVLAVCVMLFIQARSIKSENDDMVKAWMDDHSRSKKLESELDIAKRELAEMRSRRSQETVSNAEIVDAPPAEIEYIN